MSKTVSFVTEEGVRRRCQRRDELERLLERAGALPDRDRLLVEQVYGHGVSLADIARLSGQPPRQLQRRLAGLVRRMNSPLYGFLMVHGDLLSEDVLRTARLIVFEGLSLRRSACVTEQSLHRVREHVRTVRALARV